MDLEHVGAVKGNRNCIGGEGQKETQFNYPWYVWGKKKNAIVSAEKARKIPSSTREKNKNTRNAIGGEGLSRIQAPLVCVYIFMYINIETREGHLIVCSRYVCVYIYTYRPRGALGSVLIFMNLNPKPKPV